MPEEKESVALLDMDGTLADFDKAIRFDLKMVLGDDKVSEETEERIKGLIKRQPGWWLKLEPIGLGFTIAEQLKQVGFKLMILTKGPNRSTNAWTEKLEWCQKHLPDADVTITHDKGLVYGKILVDDWPPYIERWLEHRPRGVVLMPAQNWNEGFQHKQVVRVASVEQVEEMKDFLREVCVR